MPGLFALVARVDFDYLGREYAAGERFEVAAVHAAILTHDGRASFAPRAVPVIPPKPKRTYTRRDRPSQESSPRRTYRRRDLVPED